MKKVLKANKGITLISLVVTIVILLILAGVSINMVLGNNGLISKARDAKEQMEFALVGIFINKEEFSNFIWSSECS